MKRDMQLVRTILLAMEAMPGGFSEPITSSDYDAETIGHHVHLMMQAGLVTGANSTSFGQKSPVAVPLSITWDGHEFLDASRDSATWDRARGAAAKVGNASFAVLFDLLKAYALEQLGLKP